MCAIIQSNTTLYLNLLSPFITRCANATVSYIRRYYFRYRSRPYLLEVGILHQLDAGFSISKLYFLGKPGLCMGSRQTNHRFQCSCCHWLGLKKQGYNPTTLSLLPLSKFCITIKERTVILGCQSGQAKFTEDLCRLVILRNRNARWHTDEKAFCSCAQHCHSA